MTKFSPQPTSVRTFAGAEFAKSSACGQDHNCAYVSRECTDVADSKSGAILGLPRAALRGLVAGLATGALALGILGGGMTHDGADTNAGGGMTHDGIDARADVPVGGGSIQAEKDWF